jgi:transposase
MLRQLQLGQSEREIAGDLSVSRKTVAKYRRWAEKTGLLGAGALPEAQEIAQKLKGPDGFSSPGPASVVEPYRPIVLQLRQQRVEMRAIHQILREQHGFAGSYSALKRFVRSVEPRGPEPVVRVETEPGEEAQVDFGYAGPLPDPVTGKLRATWIFVMTLSWSRHQYVERVWDQSIGTWLACHVHAFEFFGGVPNKIKIDNLKAGIAKAIYRDPVLTQAYRELAEHYQFVVSPCRVRTPQHKGKVESGVHYVKRNALAGREFPSLLLWNEYLLRWVVEVAGQREHGTTHERPLERFDTGERVRLRPLPPARYELTLFKKATLHPDCHVVFEKAFYSAPYRLIGEKLLLKATPQRVEIYCENERIASHPRALRPGTRQTNPDHLPPAKVEGLMTTPQRVRERAAAIGPSTAEVVERLLQERPLDRLRAAQGIVKLRDRFGASRLEAACRRALAFEDLSYGTIKRILEKGMEQAPVEAADRGPVPQTAVFARSVKEILSEDLGWN